MDELAPRVAVLRALGASAHVTQAAAAVGVPQPTVSRWLAALGDSLGSPVVVPAGRGVRLTRAGRILADAADRSMAVLEAGWRAAQEEVDPSRGTVALGFLHLLGRTLVPTLVRGFRDTHPHVRFRLVQGSRGALLDQLATGEVDLALVSPAPTAFPSRVVLEQELVVVLPPGHHLAHRASVRMAELAAEEFVIMERGHGLRQITDALCAEAGFTPRVTFEGQESETLRGLVAAGLGITILPTSDYPDLPGVPLSPGATRTIALAWPDHPLPPAVAAFRAHAAP
ncbi:LysR substrate-binding domain-containing protein [Actinosynnema sp. NPDC020468]|uniref:LysR substrate-binding domain-containing protein n=1 Tax=Actinosynnema sp. NPDC020468 TaxID=3154488 RepID=UPI003401E19D